MQSVSVWSGWLTVSCWSAQARSCCCAGAGSPSTLVHHITHPTPACSALLDCAGSQPLLCRCLQELAKLATKRSFCREVAASVMLSALDALGAGELGGVLGDAPGVVEFMGGSPEEGGPEVGP